MDAKDSAYRWYHFNYVSFPKAVINIRITKCADVLLTCSKN